MPLLLASAGAGAAEAFQLLVTSGFVCYGVNYLLMSAVPLLLGRAEPGGRYLRAPLAVRRRLRCGAAVTLLAMVFGFAPIVAAPNPGAFALKVAFATLLDKPARGSGVRPWVPAHARRFQRMPPASH